jgi:hypothetical protein
VIHRNETEYDLKEGLKEGNEAINSPICQPMSIIFGIISLQGLVTHITGINKPDQIWQKWTPEIQHYQYQKGNRTAQKQMGHLQMQFLRYLLQYLDGF